MDIMLRLERNLFMVFAVLMTLFEYNLASRSIFDIMITMQPQECSSFTNHVNLSTSDPSIIYPPVNSDRVNYEYAITSPNFPKNYPTNIQCITLIKAPNFDYKIVIEIREKFELEPSKDCLSDFLEINDGPFGFSKNIGKFCNSELIPKEISSTGPFLWLRFYSDASLPLSGFKIVYRFMKQSVKPKIHYCYKQTIIPDDDSFNLNTSFLLSEFKNSTKFHDNASIPVECVFDFYVNPELNTLLYKSKFLKPKYPLDCPDNFMEIYHRSTVDDNRSPRSLSNYIKICQGDKFKHRVFTESNRTSVRVLIKDLAKVNDFSFIIVPIKKHFNKCPENYSQCSGHLCIPNKIICYEEIDCPSRVEAKCVNNKLLEHGEGVNSNKTSDSTTPKKPNNGDSEQRNSRTHAIILSSITIILILCMVICLVITIHSKKKDRSKNRIHLAEFDSINPDSSQNKRLFYERLPTTKPIDAALSSEKLSRKDYANNSVWSKRIVNDETMSNGNKIHDSILKLNGGVAVDLANKSISQKTPKLKMEKIKNSSLSKIGKYLSVPYPSKNDGTQNSIKSNQLSNQIQNCGIMSPSEDFQSISSHSFSKQNSTNNRTLYQHIQRASSMGSGLRRQLLESVKGTEYTKNIEWYCGPVIRGSSIESSIRNDSSEMLNTYSAKSSTHVPGCRSLPNVNYIGLQNQIYYTKPIPTNDINQDMTDSLDFSYDDNSSCKDEIISVKNHYNRDISYKQFDSKKNNEDFSSSYGFKYFCAHQPSRNNDFVEYIA